MLSSSFFMWTSQLEDREASQWSGEECSSDPPLLLGGPPSLPAGAWSPCGFYSSL